MGFFKKLAGAVNRSAQQKVLMTHGTCERTVVGGEHNAGAYRRTPPGTEVTVELVPEQSNPHDPNAVAIYLNGEKAGHLGATTGATYQAVILEANRLGYRVQAPGTTDVLNDAPTIRMRLAWADDLKRWLELPEDRRASGYVPLPPAHLTMSLKHLGDYDGELWKLLGGSDRVQVAVEYALETTERGKYADQSFIRASVEGRTIGLVPAQDRRENPKFFEAVEAGQHVGTAEITNYDGRIGVRIHVANPRSN